MRNYLRRDAVRSTRFFKAKTVLDRGEVAAGTRWMLKNRLPRGTKLRVTDVKELCLQMKKEKDSPAQGDLGRAL